jgi:hypothetical protein
MFRDRGDRYAQEIAAELDPYRISASDYEVDERLRALDTELLLADRHLLNSNDRYQMTAAHLVLARNQFVMANTITSALVEIGGEEDRRGLGFNQEHMVGFLRAAFQASREHLVTADSVMGQRGYTAEESHIRALHDSTATVWLAAHSVSSRFVGGSIEAVDNVANYVMTQYGALNGASNLVPGYKPYLDGKVSPLLTEVATRQKAIERIINSGSMRILGESVVAGIYSDAQVAMGALNRISLFLTFPQMFDSNFRVRRPLEEERPGERKFNPGVLGAVPSGPQPKPVRPAILPRPFNANVLPSAPSTEKDLQKPAPPVERPFDPSILGSSTAPQQPQEQRPFNPEVLKRRSSKEHKERPFDPSILDRKKEETED